MGKKKKGWGGGWWWDDDDYGYKWGWYYSQPKYKSSYGWGKQSYWSDYSWYFDKWASSFASSEEKREFKNSLKTKSLEKMTPIDVRVSSNDTSFIKRRRMNVNIKESDISLYKWDDKVSKIVELYDKIPFNSDLIDDGIIKYLVGWVLWVAQFADKDKIKKPEDILPLIKQYDNGAMTYSELRSYFRPLTKKEKDSELFAPSSNQWKWWGVVWDYVPIDDQELYKKNLRIIQSRIKLRDTILHEESMRKGKRINRNFITWSSLKPLINRSVQSQRKKKIFFILDCSGSMQSGCLARDPSHKAISFAAACVNSWVFDCSHVIYHSDGWWENVHKRIVKGEIFNYYGGCEWFEQIDDNLNKEWLQWVDYIVVLTDLCIGSSAEQGLADYLHKGWKHMIMSFKNKGTIKGINVRTIEKSSDMINALVTLTSN